MTISPELISTEAPDVLAKAQEMCGICNSFISLRSLEFQCRGSVTLMECLREMVMCSLRYTETVCRFEQIIARGHEANQDGAREEIERVRSTVHDSTIDAINVLSRSLKATGQDNQWVLKLVNCGRAGYGKFAVLIAFEAVLGKE